MSSAERVKFSIPTSLYQSLEAVAIATRRPIEYHVEEAIESAIRADLSVEAIDASRRLFWSHRSTTRLNCSKALQEEAIMRANELDIPLKNYMLGVISAHCIALNTLIAARDLGTNGGN